jgi:MFS family permease
MRTRTAWLVLVVVLLFSIAAPLNQFKVPPILPVLMDALNLSVSGGGLLMSVFAITGLVLALPSGLIYQKAGVRVTGLLAGGSIVLGALLGALSPGSGALLASRVVEGIGTTFAAVLAPAIIAHWFAGRQRGTAMGIWSAWVPIGTTTMSVLAPALAVRWSWQAVWWMGAAYALLATALYVALVKPIPAEAAGQEIESAGARVPSGQVLRNRSLWLLGAAFAAFSAGFVGLSTYLPTYLAERRGLPLAQAALLSSIPTLITIFSAPAGGVISDRIGSRKGPYLWGFALLAVLLPLAGAAGGPWLVALLVAQGLVIGLIPTNVFAAAVSLGDPRQAGLAMAVIMVGRSLGTLLGPIVIGSLIEASGWPAAFGSLAVTAGLGLLCGWLAKVR